MIVGWDFETHRIRPGMVAPRPVCMSMQQSLLGLAHEPRILTRHEAGRELGALLSKLNVLVGHNTAYDLVCAMAEWPELTRAIFDGVDEGRIRCTLIRQMLLDIAAGEAEFRWVDNKAFRAGRALDDLVLYYFGEHLPKDDEIRLKYGGLDGVPIEEWPERFRTYVLRDAVEPVRVFHAQEERALALGGSPHMEGVWQLEPGESIPDERPQTRAALWLQLMSAWGLRTDPEAVRALRDKHEREQEERKRALLPTGMIREDGSRDMKAIQKRVYEAYAPRGAVPCTNPSRKFPDGQVKTDSETLIESGDEHLIMLGESLSDAATVGTWLPWLELGTTTPICVGYNPIVDSGRTSARKPNIQNPPRKGDIRACFVPRGALYKEIEVPDDYVLQPGEEWVE